LHPFGRLFRLVWLTAGKPARLRAGRSAAWRINISLPSWTDYCRLWVLERFRLALASWYRIDQPIHIPQARAASAARNACCLF